MDHTETLTSTATDEEESGGDMSQGGNDVIMGKEERQRRVLQLLVETGLRLPPKVIYRNCRHRGAEFSRRSVDNYLSELQEMGYVEIVAEQEGYYAATDAGREYFYRE